jgi:hypothetical protein
VCDLIVFDVHELNGRPLTRMISYDLVYKFWTALGEDVDTIEWKVVKVCIIHSYLTLIWRFFFPI